MQVQRGGVEDIDVGLEAQRQQATFVQTYCSRGIVAEPLHGLRQREPLAARSVAHPVHQHEGRLAAIADRSAVRATVAQAESRPRVLHHFTRRLQCAVLAVAQRHVRGLAAVALEHQVVDQGRRRHTQPLRTRRDALLKGLLVVGRVAQQKQVPWLTLRRDDLVPNGSEPHRTGTRVTHLPLRPGHLPLRPGLVKCGSGSGWERSVAARQAAHQDEPSATFADAESPPPRWHWRHRSRPAGGLWRLPLSEA